MADRPGARQVLFAVARFVDDDDLASFAMACRDSWDAVKAANRTPLRTTVVAVTRNCELLKWAKEKMALKWDEDVCAAAAANGRLDVLQLARSLACPWDEWTAANAAESGAFDVLEFARSHGCPMLNS